MARALKARMLPWCWRMARCSGDGVPGISVGEVCFNTSMTGYQEILAAPSYAGRLISFTFPHIGNVGVNNNVPHYTAMTGAAAAVDGIEALSAVGLEVMPLQAYFIFSF